MLTSSSPSLARAPRLAAVALATIVVVFGLRAIPTATTPTARAGVCGVPVVGALCDAFSGSADGVRFVFDKATGTIKDAVTRKVIGIVTKTGCTAAIGAATDGIGALAGAAICSRVTDWLGNKLAGTGKSGAAAAGGAAAAAGGAAGGGAGGGNTAPSSAPPPDDGTPASVFSTGPMAALGAVAALFVATHINASTQANLTGGWFRNMYGAVSSYAWLLMVVCIAAGALYVMVESFAGHASGLGVLLGRIPMAAILMGAVPVIGMLGLSLIDTLSANILTVFPDGTHLMKAMTFVLAALGGASGILHLLGHYTMARFAGTGAWFIAAWGMVCAGAIALELIAREVAIYLTVLIVPIALVAEIYPPLARWTSRLFKALFALIASKFLLALGLGVAGTAIGAGLNLSHPSAINVILGIVTLGLVALFPALVYGALLHAEHAWHTGGSQNVLATPHHAMVQHIRAGSNRMRGYNQRPPIVLTPTVVIRDTPQPNGDGPPPTREAPADVP